MLAWHAPSAAGADADAPVPVATRPAASRPASSQPGKGGEELLRKWRWYRITWAGNSIDSQSKSDQQLVDAILKADPADIAVLREQMAPEYQRLAAAAKPDAFQCGRLASRIAVAWTRVPAGKDLSAVQAALNRRQSAEEVCHWGLQALQHLAGDIPDRYYTRYKSFVPGLAASMLSLIAGAATVIDKPGDLLDELVKIRPNIEKLAKADSDRQAQQEQLFQKLFAAIELFSKLQADKAAVLKLMTDFRQAYNGRDGKAFAALWPEGHPMTASLKAKPFAEKIDPSVWTIVRWDPVYVVVQGDLAMAFVVSQYRTKDSQEAPVKLQSFPAKRHANLGWKLN
jgi:hypothetical protein